MLRPRVVFFVLGTVALAGCAAVAGVSDYAVDPCFGGCADGPDAPSGESAPPTDGPPIGEGGVDSPSDSPTTSPGKSVVTVSGTGVAVGKSAVVTLVAKDDAGVAVPRTGAAVTFTATGGTSVVTFGATVDKGDGTYRATVTGVTEGTKLAISATIDGAPLTTPPASLRVVNPVATGLTLSLDAANADAAGNFGGKGCAAAGLAQWTDLTVSAFPGTLKAFAAPPCSATSGWTGNDTPENPFRVAFDGVDDHVDFGNVNSLAKQTILAWVRQTGLGKPGTTGTGGFQAATPLPNIVPIVSKGTAEAEADDKDIAYYLGITTTNHVGSDYESATAAVPSSNAPLMGATVLANDTWYMVGLTLDAVAGTRKLYLNGKEDASVVATNVPSTGSNALTVIGGAKRTTDGDTCPAGLSGCARFQGDIAVVLTYDHALTPAEIETNCHSFSSRFGITNCPN